MKKTIAVSGNSSRSPRSFLILSAICFSLFLILSLIVKTTNCFAGINGTIHNLFAQHQSSFLFNFMLIITELGDGIVVGIISSAIVLSMLVRKEKAPAILLALTMTSISLTVPLLKFLIHKSRPMEGLYENWETFSFPSGHTTLNITLYLCILLLFTHHFNFKHRILTSFTTFLLLFLICFYRVYLNAHWLTDIVGGVFLGIGWACLFFYLFLHQLSQHQTNKSSSIYFVILIASILTVWPLHSFKVFQNDVTRYTSNDH